MTEASIWSAIMERKPDFVIGDPDNPYMLRWFIVPRDPDRDVNLYLHKIVRDDDDRALHDHPWDSVSIVLDGTLREITRFGPRLLEPGQSVHRPADFAHRLELVDGPVLTLFAMGPRKREWGFLCPDGSTLGEQWVPWYDFVDPDNPGARGRGCGE